MIEALLIDGSDTKTGLGIRQQDTFLTAASPCHKAEITFNATSTLYCTDCFGVVFPRKVLHPSQGKPVFELTGGWRVTDLVNFVERWTGLTRGQDFELDINWAPESSLPF